MGNTYRLLEAAFPVEDERVPPFPAFFGEFPKAELREATAVEGNGVSSFDLGLIVVAAAKLFQAAGHEDDAAGGLIVVHGPEFETEGAGPAV